MNSKKRSRQGGKKKGMLPKKSSATSMKKARLYLLRGESISEGLKTIASLQLEKAIEELGGNNVSPEPVHNARTYIKKTRAIIQLASPALGSIRRDYLLGMLHEAAIRLAPLRDSEVQVQSLDLLLESEGLPPEEYSSLRNGLADIAKQQRNNDIRQIPRVLNFLKKILKTVPKWPINPLEGKDLRRRVRRIYRRGRTTLDLCTANNDPEVFHHWRKLVKQLCYTLRITSRFWPDEATSFIGSLNSIGEFSGREHDLTLLTRTLRKGPQNASSARILGIITTHLPKLHRRAMEAGIQFYESRPREFVMPLEL
jgi:CHAD domain-containing protein